MLFFEEFVRRSLMASPSVNKSFFDSWWVDRGKMRVLTKGFSRLEMCFNIQYGMVMESIAFVYNFIQKCSLSI